VALADLAMVAVAVVLVGVVVPAKVVVHYL